MPGRTDMSSDETHVIVGHANTFHDPAVCILSGEKVFCEALERHMQRKRAIDSTNLWYSIRDIRRAIRELEMSTPRDIVVVSTWSTRRVERRLDELGLNADRLLRDPNLYPLFANQLAKLRMEPLFVNAIEALFSGEPLSVALPERERNRIATQRISSKQLAHHLCHASNAVYTSSYDACMVVVLDGFGESSACSIYHFHDDEFTEIPSGGARRMASPSTSGSSFAKVDVEHDSLGFFYGQMTDLCGFDAMAGEEWKMMGLAAYGTYLAEVGDALRKVVRVDGLRVFVELSEATIALIGEMVGGFRKHGDPDIMRSADLAHTVQIVFEDVVLELLRNVRSLGLSANLAYAGGCALNSSLNGKILGRTGFESLHVPSAPADDGNALGAALYEAHFVRGGPRQIGAASPYLGSTIDPHAVAEVLARARLDHENIADENKLCETVAALLDAGEVVGWLQGRAEFGPRALGNRSILADPRRREMRKRINDLVKFREEYRPIAPSILHEHGPEYFQDYQESPYMERALLVRPEMQARVPAIVHEDGTARLHSVRGSTAPRYWALLQAFYRRSGTPLVVNTSFNVMGRPMAHDISDALAVFVTTGLDALVIGNYVVRR
jgi:carbamoyltransferase